MAPSDNKKLSPPRSRRPSTTYGAPGGSATTVEVYPLIVARARNLIRAGVPRGWTGLKPIDAIHIATAQQMGVAEMHTRDERLFRYKEIVGFPITEPHTLGGQMRIGTDAPA